MDNSALVKYYDPRTGKYEFATVLDIGDLKSLNTQIKTDLVSAINSLQDSDWGKLPPETIEDLENIKDSIGSLKDGTFVIEEWGSLDQYFQMGIEDAIDQLNIFNREQIVITAEEIEAAIKESKDYYDQHLAETMQGVESAKTDMANAQQTLNETAQRLEDADLNYSEVTLKVDEIDQYIEGNIKSVKFDIVNAVTREYESLVRQMEDEFGVSVEESFLSYLTGRVGKAESDISVQSGKIESKVGYDEFQYMPVEDIDQYNKNLLFHTMDFSEDWERNDVRAYITNDSFRHTRIISMDISNAYYSSITDTLEIGKTYTLSASFNIQPITKAPNEDKFTPTDGNYEVSAFVDNVEYPMVDLVENMTGVNGFKRLSVSIVPENENPVVYFRIKNLNAETSTGYMTAPKLEAGDKSTPWQPHFDDEYATMLSTNSLIRQQGNEIVSLISTSKDLDDKFVTATSSFQQLEDGFIRSAEAIEEYEGAVTRYGMEVEELNDRITQKVWIDDFSDAVESISIDGKNRVLNSDFVDMSTDNNQLVLGGWENVDPLFTIEKIDGINYAVIKRTGLTGNIVASMTSNKFAAKNDERLMFGFDIIVEAMPDVGSVFQIELLDINDVRVGIESFTLGQMNGDISIGEVSRLNYQYTINREDVSKARVRLMLSRNGHVKFTRVMAQQGTIRDTEWSPAPEDAQLIRMKMQTEINQTAEQIQLLANDERLDAINDILYRKEGKLEVSPTEILARVTSAELGEDAVVTGTQLKLTDEALRFDLVGKDGLIQSINASEEELKIEFDRVEVDGMLIAKILSTEYLDVSQGFKIMNGSHMVLGISPNNDFIIDADRILVNSNQVLTTDDKDEINKKIDESWIYQDPEGVIIGAISQELEKSKSDPQSTFSEMWSNITVNAEGIEAAVSKDGVIQSINLSNEEALIDFDKVRITGELLAALISAEKIDITDNFGIYYQDKLVFGVDSPTQTIHINSNNIMVNGKRVAIIDDVLTVDGKVIDLTGRVDGHDTWLTNVDKEVDAAIAEAEAAKLAAQKAYEDAIEEAESKVQAKDKEYKLIFEEYDSTVESIEADTQTAKTKAEQALTDVGISTDLAQTAKDLATTAQTNSGNAITQASEALSQVVLNKGLVETANNLASEAKSQASAAISQVELNKGLVTEAKTQSDQAVVKAQEANTNAQTALTDAQTALSTAKNADTKSGLAETAANTAKTNAQTALDDAQAAIATAGSADGKAGQAIAKANAIPTTITDIIADKDLVNGSYVGTKIDSATGAWSQELIKTEGVFKSDISDVTNNLNELIFKDKTEILSGTEIFTDKADDNSVVHVEVDGKSYQHAGSGKNLFNAGHFVDNLTSNGVSKGNISLIDIENSYFKYNTVGNMHTYISYLNGTFKENTSYTISLMGRLENKTDDRAQTTFGFKYTDDSSRTITINSTEKKYTLTSDPNKTVRTLHIGWAYNGTAYIQNMQLEEGTTATSYEPPAPTPDYPIEIHSLNDFDVVSSVGRDNMFSVDDFIQENINKGYNRISRVEHNGNPAYESLGISSIHLIPRYLDGRFKSNTQYTISWNVEFLNYTHANTVYSFLIYHTDGSYVTASSYVNSLSRITLTSTPGKTVSYITTSRQYTGDAIVYNIQLNEGVSSLPYSISPEDISESDNHPLIDKINLLLNEPLRSVGDVKDRLFRDVDGLWKVERNVGEKVFDGTENGWTTTSEQRFYYSNSSIKNIPVDVTGALSTHYKSGKKSTDFAAANDYIVQNGDSGRLYFLPINKYPSLTDWKNYLASEKNKGTPLVVQHILATPIVENLPQSDQDKLNNLRTFKDSNYIYTALPDKSNILSENLKPTLHATFKSKAYYEDYNVTSLALKNNILEGDFKVFNAQYTQDVTGLTGRLTTVETRKLEGSTFQTFKENEYQVTAEKVSNTMTRVDTAEGKITTQGTAITQHAGLIENKAEKTVVDSLSGTVSSQGTSITQNATDIASKASNSSVDSLTGRVKTAETSITQNATDIKSKASQTEVDTVKGTVDTHTTTIGQHATEITSKASATSVNNLTGRVGTAETSIAQNATDIASKAETSLVNTIKGTVDSHTTEISQNATAIESKASSTSVSTLTGRVTTAETSITQQAKTIASKASQTEVDTVKGTVSGHTTTLSQHATAISSKAETELVNTIKGTVDTHTTEISQNATAITNKANATTVDTLTGRVDTAESNISQNATAITQRVTTTTYNTGIANKENTVLKQSTAPAHVNGRLWLDTSVTPNILNRSTGTTWVKATPTTASEVGAYSSGQGSALAGRVTTAETNITQTSTAITSKADKSVVDTLSGTVSTHGTTLTQHATTISSKAAQTEVDTVKGTVSGHTTLISQNATAISARLTTSQVNSLVDGKGLAKTTYVDTQIKATADGIKADMTKVEGKIDNLQVGGRNLLKETSNLEITSTTERQYIITKPLELGTHVISFYAKANTNTSADVYINDNSGAYRYGGTSSSVALTTGMKKYVLPIEVTKFNSSEIDDYFSLRIRAVGSVITDKEMKLEKGNIATDWSPAPEDTMMENDFTVFKGEYEATAESLSSRLTAIDKVGGRLSTAETKIGQNATAISARLTTSQVNSLVDGKGLATATYVNNQIKATADGIRVDMTRVEGKVDGIQVGGRNLVLNSSALEASGLGSASGSQAEYQTITTGQSYMDLENGEIITVSFDLEMKIATANPTLMVYNTNRKGPVKINTGQVANQIQGSVGETINKRISFTSQAIIMDSPTYNYNTVEFYSEYGSSNFYRISKLKIERGNMATDWSPAPEDTMMENDFTVFKNSYNTTVSGINTELSKTAKTTDLKGMVTESTLSTKNFVTAGTMTTTLANYAQKNGVPTNTQFNTLKNSYDSMVQTIGTNGSKIAQMVMTDSLFSTTVRDSVEIGGRNLFLNSDREIPSTRQILINTYDVMSHLVGQQVSVSFDIKLGAGGISRPIQIYRYQASGISPEIRDGYVTPTTQWVRYSFTGPVLNTAVPSGYTLGSIGMYDWAGNNNYVIRRVQFEKGNVATDWTPAPEDKANQSQVNQLAGSWALTLKSGNDIKTQINASTDSIRLQSKLIHLSGTSLIDNAVIKSAHIDTLNANKIVGNTAEFNTIRTGVLQANVITATHILGDNAMFDKLFSNVAATNRLVARGAWIESANIINLNADKITAGTIRTQLIGRNYARKTSYIESTPNRNNDHLFTQPLDLGVYTLTFYAKANTATTATVYLNDDEGLGRLSGTCSPASISIGTGWQKYTVQVNVSKFDRNIYNRLFIRVYGSATTSLISTKEFMFAKGYVAMDYIPAPEDNPTAKDLSTYGSVTIHGGNITASTIDVGKITGDYATFMTTLWESTNSKVKVDGGAIRINNSAGDFATMNSIPEFRSQDANGTASIMGKGRSHYYSGSQSRFYIGSNLEGLSQYGVHIAKGQTWGVYRNSDSYGGTPAQYYNTPVGWGAVQVIEELMRLGLVSNVFATASAHVRSLNGWGSSWPVLQPGDPVLYKAAVAGNSSGVETIMSMGTATNGTTRIYSHVHQVFAGGYSESSDRRLKHDIVPTQVEALNHITSLSFKEFKWNKDNRYEPLGIIAQDSGIIRVPDAEMEGINTTRAVMLGLKGIQELNELVKAQAEEIKLLKEIINQ